MDKTIVLGCKICGSAIEFIPCDRCEGSGYLDEEEPCDECDATGEFLECPNHGECTEDGMPVGTLCSICANLIGYSSCCPSCGFYFCYLHTLEGVKPHLCMVRAIPQIRKTHA